MKKLFIKKSLFINGCLTLLASFPFCCFVSTARADAITEMASFSVFNQVNLSELAKMDVKTGHGAPMSSPRLLSVQSCYVVPRAPAQEIATLRKWSPTRHPELKIFLHSDLPSSPGPESFSRLRNAPNNDPVRTLVDATKKLSPELQISRDEAKKFSAGNAAGGGGVMPAEVAVFWSNLLAARAKAFAAGGTSQQPPYEHTGKPVRAGDELNALLRQQEKIRRQFSGLIESTGIGRGSGSLKPEQYWELLDVDDQGVLALGAFYNRGGASGTHQAADMLYYASGGFYAGLTLYQMWPVQVEGRASTLVWRGDFISSGALASLRGVERLGSESAMLKDVAKAVKLYRRDTAGNR